MLKFPTVWKRYLQAKKKTDFFRQVSPTLPLGVATSFRQTALVGVSGIIGAQMGKYNRSVMVAVYVTPFAIPHRKE
jgi:hypothetical protein